MCISSTHTCNVYDRKRLLGANLTKIEAQEQGSVYVGVLVVSVCDQTHADDDDDDDDDGDDDDDDDGCDGDDGDDGGGGGDDDW